MAYLGLLALSFAAQLSGCFVLLDAGPYRLEGGGGRRWFILPLFQTAEGGWSEGLEDVVGG
jgi:hypothetical protein